jgi:hypothetical protein
MTIIKRQYEQIVISAPLKNGGPGTGGIFAINSLMHPALLILLILVLVLLLVLFLRRNNKDRKNLEQKLNQDYTHPKKDKEDAAAPYEEEKH